METTSVSDCPLAVRRSGLPPHLEAAIDGPPPLTLRGGEPPRMIAASPFISFVYITYHLLLYVLLLHLPHSPRWVREAPRRVSGLGGWLVVG